MSEADKQEKQDNKRSEDLSADHVVVNDNVILKHIGKEINRVVRVSNNENKPYYFLSEYLTPGSVRCSVSKKTSVDGKGYTLYNFSLKGDKKKQKEEVDVELNQDLDQDLDQNPEAELEDQKEQENQEPIEPSESQQIITRLNAFKRGITDRIRYRMMIPQYPEQTSYILTLKTIKLNNHVKFSNIIEFQQLKNNFGFRAVSNILATCRCKLLFKVESVTLTHSNVFLDIRLVRIFPESLDSLQASDKLFVLNELNAVTAKNINRYNELNQFTKKQRSSKDQVRSELKKILSI